MLRGKPDLRIYAPVIHACCAVGIWAANRLYGPYMGPAPDWRRLAIAGLSGGAATVIASGIQALVCGRGRMG
jgi:hypothetical protein